MLSDPMIRQLMKADRTSETEVRRLYAGLTPSTVIPVPTGAGPVERVGRLIARTMAWKALEA